MKRAAERLGVRLFAKCAGCQQEFVTTNTPDGKPVQTFSRYPVCMNCFVRAQNNKDLWEQMKLIQHHA